MAKPRTHRMRVCTDTATLAVFDPVRLRHRLTDPADWWTIREWAVAEMNAANLLAVDLGSDGIYRVTIHLDTDHPADGTAKSFGGLIGCESGTLYVGPGEQITAHGLEPDPSLDGVNLPVPVGVYRVHVAFAEPDELDLCLEPTSEPARNEFADYVRV